MRILCVDDVFVVRKLVKTTVDALKGEFLEASNGKEALDILEKHQGKIDLILLDWNMPEMNGIEFLHTVKSNENYKYIPVIMITSENEKNKIIEAVQAGVSNYLIKPFSEQDLAKKIMNTVVSCQNILNTFLCKEMKNSLSAITGLKVEESQADSGNNAISENYFSGQMLITGEVYALISIRISKENSARLFSLVLEKPQEKLTPEDIARGLLKLLKTVSDKTAAVVKNKMNITFAYLFAGFIGENMTVLNSSKKLYNLNRKFNTGLLETYLQILHY